MKIKYLLLILGCLFTLTGARSQDVLYKTDGTELKVKVYEIKTDTVDYFNYGESEDSVIRKIALINVFMIIYENGTREVFKTEEPNDPISASQTTEISAQSSTGIVKGNISFSVLDKRQEQLIIGKAPSKAARAVGLIVQPTTEIKDEGKIIYGYAEKTLSQILLANGFRNDGVSDYHLEIIINDLYSKTEVGLYGGGGSVTQNCSVTVVLKYRDNILFNKDFSSIYSGKTTDFYDQVELLRKHYYSINDNKAFKSRRKQDYKEFSNKGFFVDYIILINNIVIQLDQSWGI
ncbi:MAG: hypothetical protein JXB49_02455 [Bacteroidales bacterium]|nr:hypothetical protein [Bacteroidales bacterium]